MNSSDKNLLVIEKALSQFYQRRIEKLSENDIFRILKRKNPYLYRAFGTNDGYNFVRDLLMDTQTSSDETLFGDFFEEVAINITPNGRKSSTDSIDLEVWSEDMKSVKLYAVKSGPNVFNAMSKKRQNDAFQESQKRLKGIAVTPIVGYSYGRKKTTKENKNVFEEVAGQLFWKELTGDENFYIKLIDYIGMVADEHKESFKSEWDKCLNKLFKKFMDVFGNEDGSLNWEEILKFNSSSENSTVINKKIKMAREGKI
ncbi:MAG: PmeII family type II restriction endonuclease [Cetobacterium sp.]